MEAWEKHRQRAARDPRRGSRRGLSRGTIIYLALLVGFVAVISIVASRENHAVTTAAATRAVTLKDGDYAAIDVRDLAANPDANKQRPIQLRGKVVRIGEVHVGTYVLLSVPTRDGAQRWEVWVQYGGKLPGITPQATITVFGVGDGREGGRNAWAGYDQHLVVRADRVVLQP